MTDPFTHLVVLMIGGGAHGLMQDTLALIAKGGAGRKPHPPHLIQSAGAVTGAFYRWRAEEEAACLLAHVSSGRRR